MHESSLAKELLAVVLGRAGAVGADGADGGDDTGRKGEPKVQRVRAVRGWVAESEALSRESLAFHFAAHARGTMAEGAALELRLVHIEARCRACGRRYAPEHHLLLCPRCGSTDGELLGQPGLGLEALEVE
ncbi:MAG TPA: hydrogenase maturation nickel metallochaperone HypA [Polyangia bacterium]|nr:hydrogenase maturation nickel metallochaperone HypA [Polyangia bacterium]